MADITDAAEASSPPTYEELAQIELDFEDVDTEIIARQEHLTTPIYTRRSLLARRIPNFWPLVFEQAPPDIDQYIQPSDSAIFAACLLDMSVTRFETASTLPANSSGSSSDLRQFGEPRSLAFKFTFSPNEWFEDQVLEKHFYYRRARNGWTGRVSNPVKIRWKKGKDLTSGLLDAAVKLFEAEGKELREDQGGAPKEYETLRQKVEASTEGSQSFFTWFGFRGPHVGAEESREAVKLHDRKRRRTNAKPTAEDEAEASSTKQTEKAEDEAGVQSTEEEDDEAANDEIQSRFAADAAVEIFPDGEDLAISLAEDLWPSATKYFVAAQEDEDGGEGMSDEDFEEDDDAGDGHGDRSDGDADGSDNDGDGLASGGDEVPDLRKLVGSGGKRNGEEGKGAGAGRSAMDPPSRKKRRT